MALSQDTQEGRCCPCRLALAVGIVWGLGVFLLGAITTCTETYGHKAVKVLGSIYCGYRPASWGGAFFGLLWGFAHGFIVAAVVTGLYALLNRTGGCCCRRAGANGEPEAVPPADADA